jgi:PHD/YefM family antitoxin component YafN of YafNO toxin-antitoxin module
MTLHPRRAKENGQDVVILPHEEFVQLREMAEDYEDLLDLEEAIKKNADEPTIPYEQVRKELGL